jgi:glycosyltransferase involved in cell wall biosynthesis
VSALSSPDTLGQEAPAALSERLVSVVLCTYNGALYLQQMLDSLAAQTLPVRRLVLRDDGSSDDSLAIVARWADRRGLELRRLDAHGTRLGPAHAFLTALIESGPADVHLLADQDDVWLPDKVERAVRALAADDNEPALYASSLQVVNHTLSPLWTTPTPRCLSFASAACESVLTGCTMALNEPLRALVADGGIHDEMLMHDWWLYLVSSAFGRIEFDPQPSVLYRQHGDNAIGAERAGLTLALLRLRRFAAGEPRVRQRQLLAFCRAYGDRLPASARELAAVMERSQQGSWQRLAAAVRAGITRQRWHDAVATRVAILTNRF